MQNISFQQSLEHEFSKDFGFDGFSYNLKECFKKYNIILISNFSFGGGNDGLPPELPRIQLNDEFGYYSISMSLRRVDFKVDCTNFDFSFDKFKILGGEIINVLKELGAEPFKRSVSTSVVIKMDKPVEYMRKHLLNQNNAFFDSRLACNYSVSMTDGVEYEKGWALIRITNISDAFRNIDGGVTEKFIHVYREVNNFPSDANYSRLSYDKFMEVGADNFSERSIKDVLELE
ncbi:MULTISPECIES: hypothetical protein [unclassified Serratia (in: enterobacteria)]|uniref:hypothetical protein n=1 Tax=unclassified Serratia (in: enterobacteria) TaxID=2647522 RepID=UPI002117E6DA|nr:MULTISPECIES: hypothetical protein [unclassified Serratia (in: enterobacteria)]